METKIIKIKSLEEFDISYASEILKSGGLVAFPTETVYGLGASMYLPESVKKIFQVKGRPQDNPLIVHISSIEEIEEIAYLEDRYVEIIKKLTPGPITFVLKKKKIVPDVVSAGLDTVGVRIPGHPVARKLAKLSGPIPAPSANLSGRPSSTNAESVIEDLYGKVECIIDAGQTAFGIESTIIDLTTNLPRLLRPGPFVVEELRKIFGEIEIIQKHEKALAPGMKYRHYAPHKPLYPLDINNVEKIESEKDGLIICTQETYENYFKSQENVLIFGKLLEPYTIAQNLYESFRKLDKLPYSKGYVETFKEEGLFFSIMNRIKKALEANKEV